MQANRRNTFKLLALALALSGLAVSAGAHDNDGDDDDGFRSGQVFTSTNGTAGNELLVYASGAGGTLTLQTRLATQGVGTGTGLGNQGAVTLSRNGRYLFVVNAASNTVSTFSVRRNGIALESTVDSGGLRPISVTEYDGIVYVLNANGAGNVAGFRNRGGNLTPLAGSVRGLSASGGTGAAQVGFSTEGDALVVTEKATNKLTSYRVGDDGSLGATIVTASAGATPFGFAFDSRGHLLVSEAFGGGANASAVSSYGFSGSSAQPVVISPSVGTTQTAACWVVTTPNGRYAYTTNTGSGTISSYAIQKSGHVALMQGVATASGPGPIDAAIAGSGRALFVLNSGGRSLSSIAIARDGSLGTAVVTGGLPVGANGLAAN